MDNEEFKEKYGISDIFFQAAQEDGMNSVAEYANNGRIYGDLLYDELKDIVDDIGKSCDYSTLQYTSEWNILYDISHELELREVASKDDLWTIIAYIIKKAITESGTFEEFKNNTEMNEKLEEYLDDYIDKCEKRKITKGN